MIQQRLQPGNDLAFRPAQQVAQRLIRARTAWQAGLAGPHQRSIVALQYQRAGVGVGRTVEHAHRGMAAHAKAHAHIIFAQLGKRLHRQPGVGLNPGAGAGNAIRLGGGQYKPHVQPVVALVVVRHYRQGVHLFGHFGKMRLGRGQRRQHKGAAHALNLEHRTKPG